MPRERDENKRKKEDETEKEKLKSSDLNLPWVCPYIGLQGHGNFMARPKAGHKLVLKLTHFRV